MMRFAMGFDKLSLSGAGLNTATMPAQPELVEGSAPPLESTS